MNISAMLNLLSYLSYLHFICLIFIGCWEVQIQLPWLSTKICMCVHECFWILFFRGLIFFTLDTQSPFQLCHSLVTMLYHRYNSNNEMVLWSFIYHSQAKNCTDCDISKSNGEITIKWGELVISPETLSILVFTWSFL